MLLFFPVIHLVFEIGVVSEIVLDYFYISGSDLILEGKTRVAFLLLSIHFSFDFVGSMITG